jgi:SlyX protein
MPDLSRLTERLDALETLIAHRDGTIDDLNDVVTKQWTAMEALSARIERLEATLEALSYRLENPEGEEPPPPHY